MKTTIRFTLITLFGFMLLNCNNDDSDIDPTRNSKEWYVAEFPEAKAEVEATFMAVLQSLKDGDIDKLISFHAYGPKFTEFKNGEPRNGGEENEAYERQVFGAVTEVVKLEANNLLVAAYGEVANLTFHSDFHLKFGEDLVIVNDQITLLFVKTNDGWKMVHEHHAPLN